MFGGISFRGLDRDIVDLTGRCALPFNRWKKAEVTSEITTWLAKNSRAVFTCCSRDAVS